jgi:tRNA(adenine34) deaminase
MIAITQAAEALGAWRLHGAALYVTLEPCAMCAGAMVLARIDRLVFGAIDPKAGAVRSVFRLLDDPRLNHRIEVCGGVLAQECGTILTDFFRAKRAAGAAAADEETTG